MKWGKGISVSVEVPASEVGGKESNKTAMMALAKKLDAAGIPAGVLEQHYGIVSGGNPVVAGVAVTSGTLSRVLNLKTDTFTFVWTP